MEVKIYGTGCANCIALEKTVKKAVEELNMDVEIVKVQDMDKILEAGLLSTPGFAVEGEMKSMGRVPSLDEIKKWINEKS
jgi:small redox-active disulfide protein 2